MASSKKESRKERKERKKREKAEEKRILEMMRRDEREERMVKAKGKEPAPQASPGGSVGGYSEKKSDDKIPEAVVLEGPPENWIRHSTRSLDEVKRRIDRMDDQAVDSLRSRYRERYGEDLEIPDAFEMPSVEAAQTSPESSDSPVLLGGSAVDTKTEVKKEEPQGSFLKPKSSPKAQKPKIEREPNFWDMRSTPLYFYKKAELDYKSGGGKAMAALIDILTYVTVIIPVLRVITTANAARKEGKESASAA